MFAHPDDEVFCAGGTFARYAAQDCEVKVISLTRGEAGQIRVSKLATRRTLGAVREAELRQACQRLGVACVDVLDYPDGKLATVDRGELVARIAATMRSFQPDIVITFGDDGAYGHPDHVCVSEVTGEAFVTTMPHLAGAARLYHSYFPRNSRLLLEMLARWLLELDGEFHGTSKFVHALSLFAADSTTMNYVSDSVEVNWYPAGTYVVEQGEVADSLFLILAGKVEIIQEQPDGTLSQLKVLGPGEFFGEVGVSTGRRGANAVVADDATCLVLSTDRPTAFAARGADNVIGRRPEAGVGRSLQGATTAIDVRDYVEVKVAAIAAHQTQYPIERDMFPLSMLEEMFGYEYFVRVVPPPPLEPDLFPGDHT